jgi:alpha-D-ribose 1-methylphosphonate 5-triphosphate diphosphatase
VLFAGSAEVRSATIQWSAADLCDPNKIAEPNEPYDAQGDWVLPGIIDVHGDAFERSLMPRPGVFADLSIALDDNDAQLQSSGITTSFLSATDSWEPGLRSRDTLRSLVEALRSRSEALRCRSEALGSPRGAPRIALHVRHERCNTSALDELNDWVRSGVVSMLSFNDHTPGGIAMVEGLSHGQVARSGLDEPSLEKCLQAAVSQRSEGFAQEASLAQTATAAGCVMASHDPSSESDLCRDLELGVSIAEFPLGIALALEYKEHGIEVLLGAPNLVRGSSHLGNLSVRDAIAKGVEPSLCSDYHYPSLLAAPFAIAEAGLATFGQAWESVSLRPAKAAALADRGRVANGAKADLIVVRPPREGHSARVTAAFVDGELVYQRR